MAMMQAQVVFAAAAPANFESNGLDDQRLECGVTSTIRDGGGRVVAPCLGDEERIHIAQQRRPQSRSTSRPTPRPVNLKESSSSERVSDNDESEGKSRRQMLCGLCAGIGLLMAGENSAADAAESATPVPGPPCRNCGGAGAVL